MRPILTGLLMVLAGAVLAGESARPEPGSGEATRQWLELQKSNNASWGTPRPMPAEVAERVYQRYVKSFEQPIPPRFDREAVAEGGR